ncbi:S26 family signal peptidase [Haloferacaceae archaeon DSL9]
MSSGDPRTPSDEGTRETASGDDRPTDSSTRDEAGRPRPEPGGDDPEAGVLTRFRTAQDGPLLFFREFLSSALVVLLIGLLLFGLSGAWPPMVAIQSGSMEPNMYKGDLVFVTEPGRFAPDAAHGETGVVPAEAGENAGYESFDGHGSVIVFDEPGSFGPPIIHRAHLHVEEGENWYERADSDAINAESCAELMNCPAPYDGFITKGDNPATNGNYDQTSGIAPVVKESWITGVARLRIPYLGWIRLAFTGAATLGPVLPAGTLAVSGGLAYAVGSRSHRTRRG